MGNRHLFLKPFPDFLYSPCNISYEVIFIYNDSCIRKVCLSNSFNTGDEIGIDSES